MVPAIRAMTPTLRIPVFSALATLAICTSAPADPVMDAMPMVFQRAEDQYGSMLRRIADQEGFPRTVENGELKLVKPTDWTIGFFPGSLWLLHEATGAPEWRKAAETYTDRLEEMRHFTGDHDIGFMLGCSYGNALRFSKEREYREILRDGAKALCTRYEPRLGLIRSWSHGKWEFPVIIDNMMNLELLAWASRNNGGNEPLEIAISHADKTLANHFRADGSAYHVLDYSPETGWVRAVYGFQGADFRTAWARGQAWAIYGYAMMHRITRKPEYLRAARQAVDFFFNHPNLPADKVPLWDFGAKPGPDTPRDASAAAITASALVEMSKLVPPDEGRKLFDLARQQLTALASPAYLAAAGSNGGFILTRSTGNLPFNSEINVPLNYADYYFLEALLRYRAVMKGQARPSFTDLK